MKLMGAGSILLSSLLLAFSFLQRDRLRIRRISALRASLLVLHRELCEWQPQLWTVFRRLSTGGENETVDAFFAELLSRQCELGEHSFHELWETCVKQMLSSLGGEAEALLLALGSALGGSDLAFQCREIERTCEGLEACIERAKAKLAERSRLTPGVCLSLGAFLVILLL